MAADSVGLLDNGVHAQFGDLVDERVLVAFPVLHHCGHQRDDSLNCVLDKSSKRRLNSNRLSDILTEIFPALVLIDVHVDLLDSLQSLSQVGPVVVALRRGPQQLHQQQRVTHHPLHRLDQERAEVDVVCFPPERATERADRVWLRGGK